MDAVSLIFLPPPAGFLSCADRFRHAAKGPPQAQQQNGGSVASDLAAELGVDFFPEPRQSDSQRVAYERQRVAPGENAVNSLPRKPAPELARVERAVGRVPERAISQGVLGDPLDRPDRSVERLTGRPVRWR